MNKTFGAAALIAGCSIGAGMLGLPVMMGPGGFVPSCMMLFLVYAFMVVTGIVLAEVVLSFEKEPLNLLSIAEKTLGKGARILVWLLFAFLFYGIMTAYIIGGTYIVIDFFNKVLDISLSFGIAGSILVFIMFLIITRGTALVDHSNRFLMLGMIVCYAVLVIYGIPYVAEERILRMNWSASLIAMPILVISFGYHNLVASLCKYLDRKKSALMKAIIFGSALPMVIYLIWNFVILGIVPYTSLDAWKEVQLQGEMVPQVLAKTVGSQGVIDIAQGFAFFAIATSFLPVALSFFDFLEDAFHRSPRLSNKNVIGLFVLIPPFVAALSNHTLFLAALNYSGGFCAVALFGILPALMAQARKKELQGFGDSVFIVSKKPVLMTIFVFSAIIMIVELLFELGKL